MARNDIRWAIAVEWIEPIDGRTTIMWNIDWRDSGKNPQKRQFLGGIFFFLVSQHIRTRYEVDTDRIAHDLVLLESPMFSISTFHVNRFIL